MSISLFSAAGQEAVMRKAYAKAGIDDFNETDYIECHGTRISVEDSIEVEEVSRVFKRDISKGPILIGSVNFIRISVQHLLYTRCVYDILR